MLIGRGVRAAWCGSRARSRLRRGRGARGPHRPELDERPARRRRRGRAAERRATCDAPTFPDTDFEAGGVVTVPLQCRRLVLPAGSCSPSARPARTRRARARAAGRLPADRGGAVTGRCTGSSCAAGRARRHAAPPRVRRRPRGDCCSWSPAWWSTAAWRSTPGDGVRHRRAGRPRRRPGGRHPAPARDPGDPGRPGGRRDAARTPSRTAVLAGNGRRNVQSGRQRGHRDVDNRR
jgi:hypothetical protein